MEIRLKHKVVAKLTRLWNNIKNTNKSDKCMFFLKCCKPNNNKSKFLSTYVECVPAPLYDTPRFIALRNQNIKKPQSVRVLFDIDNTIFVSSSTFQQTANLFKFPNLTALQSEHPYQDLDFFFIYPEKTKEIFEWLHENNIKIGFVTAGKWTKDKFFKLLTMGINLDPAILKDAIFFNANSDNHVYHHSKG